MDPLSRYIWFPTNKMENKKYHTISTVQICNKQKNGENHVNMTAYVLGLVHAFSIKHGGIKLVY